MPRVVVTGMGVVSPIGQSLATFFESLTSARSGVGLVPDELCPSSAHSLVAARVAFDAGIHFPSHQLSQLDRATQFALAAARQALNDSNCPQDTIGRERFGVYWGTGLGGATSIEDSYRQLYAGDGRVRPASVVLAMNNAAGGNVSIANGLRGPVLNVSTACSSSAGAIGEAYRAIKHGYADAMVAGGSEALITHGNLRAWDAMHALARPDANDVSASCKPFSADRTGIVLGEGSAALVLERADVAATRGARIYAEIAGYGNAADAGHISKPGTDGQTRAMRLALGDAEMDEREIGYLNAHGTATVVGDPIETSAIREVFGAHTRALAVSSTKAVHGHLMGAAGAIELIGAIMAMEHNLVPPTAHLDQPDPACDLDYVPNVARAIELGAVMSNSFGFGGMNSVLIARRFDG